MDWDFQGIDMTYVQNKRVVGASDKPKLQFFIYFDFVSEVRRVCCKVFQVRVLDYKMKRKMMRDAEPPSEVLGSFRSGIGEITLPQEYPPPRRLLAVWSLEAPVRADQLRFILGLI